MKEIGAAKETVGVTMLLEQYEGIEVFGLRNDDGLDKDNKNRGIFSKFIQ